jgi:hypothetical protein
MKNLIVLLITFSSWGVFSQFSSETDVITYLDGKKFYNSEYGLTMEYGYLSEYNTYGIKLTNKYNAVFNFINVSITPYESFASLNGMSLSSGDNLEFTLYKGKAVAEGSEYILIK